MKPLTDLQVLSFIVEYGLMTRQIPVSVTETNDISFAQDGDEIVEHEITQAFRTRDGYEKFKKSNKESKSFRFDDEKGKAYRLFCKRKRIPKHAGYWMVAKSNGTGSTVIWDTKTCNLAPTLEESVRLFLTSYIEPATFTLEGEFGPFKGYHNPSVDWNGWACPYFERHVVDAMIEAQQKFYPNAKLEWVGDNVQSHITESPFYKEEGPDVFEKTTIKVNGRDIEVWPVGSHYWIWTVEKEA